MAAYGDTALGATALYSSGQAPSPRVAWDQAAATRFPNSPSSQTKGCPRGTFLGLCEAGVVKGIPPGTYTRANKNKAYALGALALLGQEPELADKPAALWQRLVGGRNTFANHQMDVVLTLWRAGMLDSMAHP